MQIPFSPSLEKQMYPTRFTIAAAIRKVAGLAPATEQTLLAALHN